GNARIPAGRVENRFAGTQRPAFLSIADHCVCGAIFYRAARIEPFRLGEEFDVRKLPNYALDSQQRCVADLVQQAFAPASNGRGLIESQSSFVCRGKCYLAERVPKPKIAPNLVSLLIPTIGEA